MALSVVRISHTLKTLELTDLLRTDFGSNRRNLLVRKFSFAKEMCEICALDAYLAKRPLRGGHGRALSLC
jgi:hypothetical protein